MSQSRFGTWEITAHTVRRAASQRRLVAIAGSLREWPPPPNNLRAKHCIVTPQIVGIEGGPEAAAQYGNWQTARISGRPPLNVVN
jgi:hypothetical protein